MRGRPHGLCSADARDHVDHQFIRQAGEIIGDVDWATGSNITSQTISRFNIEVTDMQPF
jgi:hypothetical protein